MSPISRITKRSGQIVIFDQNKITEAIWRAAQSVGGKDRNLAEKISNQICAVLEVFFKSEANLPTVEQIQDLVEKILIESGHAKTAKAYILYREEHHQLRRQKNDILRHVVEKGIIPPVKDKVQDAFKKFSDNEIKKIIQSASDASIETMKKIYLLGYQAGLDAAKISPEHELLKSNPLPKITSSPKKTFHQQIAIPFVESVKENSNTERKNFYSYPEKTASKPLKNQKIQEILPPPVEAKESLEGNINKYRLATNFKSLNPKHCPKCKAITQTGEGCLLCLQCGFSVSVVER